MYGGGEVSDVHDGGWLLLGLCGRGCVKLPIVFVWSLKSSTGSFTRTCRRKADVSPARSDAALRASRSRHVQSARVCLQPPALQVTTSLLTSLLIFPHACTRCIQISLHLLQVSRSTSSTASVRVQVVKRDLRFYRLTKSTLYSSSCIPPRAQASYTPWQ